MCAGDLYGEEGCTKEIAMAKIRVNEAAGKVSQMAHQVLAAIGFTYEHTLHHSTRRLWSWRDEYGTETDWENVIMEELLKLQENGLWSMITDVKNEKEGAYIMKDLLFTVENDVAKIILNRPERLNAFSVEMIDLWIEALEHVRDSENIRVLVISGKGRGFCSGGDIKSMQNGQGFLHSDGKEDLTSTALARKNAIWKKVQRIPLILQEIDKPVICCHPWICLWCRV